MGLRNWWQRWRTANPETRRTRMEPIRLPQERAAETEEDDGVIGVFRNGHPVPRMLPDRPTLGLPYGVEERQIETPRDGSGTFVGDYYDVRRYSD